MQHVNNTDLCTDSKSTNENINQERGISMEHCLKVGILGAGNIAGSMAEALEGLQKEEKACLWAVASRSYEKAKEFAKTWNAVKVYESYEKMAEDPQVELIYIATPHSFHYEHAKLCIERGKNVLVEKAFTANARQAEGLFALAKEKNVFITEAIWTRYLPSREIITAQLEAGVIGTPQILEAEFSVPNFDKPRMHDPALCGGALLDLGVYVLTTASVYFGDEIVKTESSCVKYATGVDATDLIRLTYKNGRAAELRCSMVDAKRNCVKICGTNGYISWDSNNNPRNVELHRKNGSLVRKIAIPSQINGYEYEVLASREAILKGRRECAAMPHAETLRIMRQMDALRTAWGVKYPYDNQEPVNIL